MGPICLPKPHSPALTNILGFLHITYSERKGPMWGVVQDASSLLEVSRVTFTELEGHWPSLQLCPIWASRPLGLRKKSTGVLMRGLELHNAQGNCTITEDETENHRKKPGKCFRLQDVISLVLDQHYLSPTR